MSTSEDLDEQDTGTTPPTDPRFFLESLLAEGQEWWKAQKRHATLYAYEKLGHAVGHLLGVALVTIAVVMFVIFASLALAIWLGGLMGSMSFGFLVVAGIYLLMLLVLHFILGPRLRKLITLMVINLLYSDEQ